MKQELTLPAAVDAASLPRAERTTIQRWYDQAVQFAGLGDAESREEAHRRLAACLERDPGNSLYTELMLKNFQHWERPQCPPAWWKVAIWRRQVGRAERRRDWLGVQRRCWQAMLQWQGEALQEVLQQWARSAAAYEQWPCALILLQHWPESGRHVNSWSLAAQVLTRMGRFEDAAAAWREVRSQAPEHPLAPAAGKLVGEEEVKDVKDVKDTATALTDTDGMIAEAERLAAEDRWTLAQQALQRAMSASPGEPKLTTAWEELQLRHVQRQQEQAEEQGMGEAFLAELADLRERLELEIFDARATRCPEELQWRLRASRILTRQARWRAAQRQLEPLPEPPATDDPQFPSWLEAMELLAELLQRQREFEAALQHYSKVIEYWDGGDGAGRRALGEGARLAAALGRTDLAQSWRDLGKTTGMGRQAEADEG